MTWFERCASSLIITILLCVALSTGSLAEVYQDSIHYPSSTVCQDENLMLDAKQSFDAIDRTRQDGLNILHSYIDRDPIDIEEDLQKYNVCERSISTCNTLPDVFSTQHQQWRSPLERIYPLRSGKPPFDTESTILDLPPRHIHNGPRHNHKISPPIQPQPQSPIRKALKTETTITALLACNSNAACSIDDVTDIDLAIKVT
jgi:hypothetical protein